jgi:hypothetical protein
VLVGEWADIPQVAPVGSAVSRRGSGTGPGLAYIPDEAVPVNVEGGNSLQCRPSPSLWLGAACVGCQVAYSPGVGFLSFSYSMLCINVYVGPDCVRASVYKYSI